MTTHNRHRIAAVVLAAAVALCAVMPLQADRGMPQRPRPTPTAQPSRELQRKQVIRQTCVQSRIVRAGTCRQSQDGKKQ